MKALRPLRVLVLVQKGLVPPDEATAEELPGAPWKMEYGIIKTLRSLGHAAIPLAIESNLGVIREAMDREQPQIAFNCLEGFDDVATWDANVVAYLEMLKLPYTGCNSRGMLLGRDKSLTKTLLSYHRIPVPRFLIVARGRKVKRPNRLAFPLFVKSLTMDSSIGISQASVVETDAKLQERVTFIHESIGTDALVEQYIEGREMYVGILGNQRLQALPVWELSFAKMPEESQKIATERLKWSRARGERRDARSGAPGGGPRRCRSAGPGRTGCAAGRWSSGS